MHKHQRDYLCSVSAATMRQMQQCWHYSSKGSWCKKRHQSHSRVQTAKVVCAGLPKLLQSCSMLHRNRYCAVCSEQLHAIRHGQCPMAQCTAGMRICLRYSLVGVLLAPWDAFVLYGHCYILSLLFILMSCNLAVGSVWRLTEYIYRVAASTNIVLQVCTSRRGANTSCKPAGYY